MKKIIVLSFCLFLFTILGANSLNMFRVGFLAPKDTSTGTILGYCFGSNYDNTVLVYGSGDLFYRRYSKGKKISYADNAGNPAQTVLKTTDISTYYIPLQINGQVYIPTNDNLKLYFGGGIGLGLLWEDVFVAADSYHNTINETKYFDGLNWSLCGGVRYPLSRHTALIGELFYNAGKMKRNMQVTPIGITWDEINMNGIGMRIGLEVPSL
jgi:hypothetical protein